MDTLTIDYTSSDGNIIALPIKDANNVIFDESTVVAQQGLEVGTATGGITGGYTLPTVIGTDGYVLASNVASNSLVWTAVGGGLINGGLINGGNTGTISMGSLTANTTIISGGIIHIGTLGLSNRISLNGSVEFQYDNISTALGTLTLNSDYFFVEITNAGTNEVLLPDASTTIGRQYIISKGFVGSTLTITTSISDNIDGSNTITLNIINQRIQLISNGLNKWLIL